MNAADTQFLETLAKLNNSNPFSRERLELERQALGDAYRPDDDELWSRTPHTRLKERPNVALLTERADEMAVRMREKLQAGETFDRQLQEQYDALATYVLYYRHVAVRKIDEIAGTATQAKRHRVWREFWSEYQLFFSGTARVGHDRQAAAHLFACLFQVRRAFKHIFDCILGESLPVARLREQVWQSIFTHDLQRYRRSLYHSLRELPTLITGPSGTGKELVARSIAMSQYLSFDPEQERFVEDHSCAFTPLNLSALSPTLIESELFGHRRGAFTGADADRVGWLEACRPHGAVFLDEIGELDMTIQVKLLRVLQQRTYCRIGESNERTFAGKIIAATNRDLAAEMHSGQFRHDLFYRLCADLIETPSLAAQLADRPAALEGLVLLLAERIAPGEANTLASEALQWIAKNLPADYAWPGNIRELEQCVRNILVRGEYRPHTPQQVSRVEWLANAESGKLSAEQMLRSYATWLYAKHGTYEAVAKQMEIDRRTVKSKIDQAMLAKLQGSPSKRA
ncbi:sigma 54-interacting transcriptional regulator [Aeoliella mucimassa]|uniref:Transcriptional regulatory protein ZraR n=1 Tax=Aeoliella mucimassa TaxID=2527972 RepID=A0A518AJA9_9BACT|nr:sigma-54 factor interaction domain-containing protein [Aeoliella mucimassa]QDU54786.1 Transcriptional regulatory protein ZraR [Aeoliella mucimassa]